MRLTFLQSFPNARVEEVWTLVTDPVTMNTWSTAKLTPLSLGAEKTYNSVGALRRLTVQALGRTTLLDEVIEESEPPHRLVYRVYHGAPIRFHRGEMTLTEDTQGVHFRWDVDLEGPAAILATLRFVLERDVGRSVRAMPNALTQMSQQQPSSVRRAPAASPAFVKADASDLAQHLAAAKNTLQRQAELSARLRTEGSPHYWFARVYEFVSEEQIRFLDSRDCKNPVWVAALVPAFFAYYERNLRTHVERAVPAEKHWQKAFGRAEHCLPHTEPGVPAQTTHSKKASAKDIARAILHGAKAHIEGDLPRAIAEISAKEFPGVPVEYFRPDYALMGSLFRRAANRVFLEAARDRPFDLRMQAYRAMPKAIRAALFAEGPYNIPEARMKAFEEAIRLTSPP